ncbi:hypothetical protein [Ammonifex thiophilus]|uniref:Uncharacterized protein n=1 Tax=Ammonifex thiophilus TaxID=444093 RepID=A0A3D8P450_9THEO|nr:hypothetical protein [Ammonifex thiophilus]RDV81838.1 hypothetical protein DXX99_08670 [Ammonifex thiophilus]
MDEEVRRFAWGHRRLRHDYKTAVQLSELYRSAGLGEQAFLEAVLHIAADWGFVTRQDYEVMRDITLLARSRGRRRPKASSK